MIIADASVSYSLEEALKIQMELNISIDERIDTVATKLFQITKQELVLQSFGPKKKAKITSSRL